MNADTDKKDDNVLTVVFRNVTSEQVQELMDHPQSVYFGWCHAPHERDAALAKLEKAKVPA